MIHMSLQSRRFTAVSVVPTMFVLLVALVPMVSAAVVVQPCGVPPHGHAAPLTVAGTDAVFADCVWDNATVTLQLPNNTRLELANITAGGNEGHVHQGYIVIVPAGGLLSLRNVTVVVRDSVLRLQGSAVVFGVDHLEDAYIEVRNSTVEAHPGAALAIAPGTTAGDFILRRVSFLCVDSTVFSRWAVGAVSFNPAGTQISRSMVLAMDPVSNPVTVETMSIDILGRSNVSCEGHVNASGAGCSAAAGFALFSSGHVVRDVVVSISGNSFVGAAGTTNTVVAGVCSIGSTFVNVTNFGLAVASVGLLRPQLELRLYAAALHGVLGGVIAAAGTPMTVSNFSVDVEGADHVSLHVVSNHALPPFVSGTVAFLGAISADFVLGASLELSDFSVVVRSTLAVNVNLGGVAESIVSRIAVLSILGSQHASIKAEAATFAVDDGTNITVIVAAPALRAVCVLSVCSDEARNVTLSGLRVTLSRVSSVRLDYLVPLDADAPASNGTAVMAVSAVGGDVEASGTTVHEMHMANATTTVSDLSVVTVNTQRRSYGLCLSSLCVANRRANLTATDTHLSVRADSKIFVNATMAGDTIQGIYVLSVASLLYTNAFVGLHVAHLTMAGATRLELSDRSTVELSVGAQYGDESAVVGLNSGLWTRVESSNGATIMFTVADQSRITYSVDCALHRASVASVLSRGATRLSNVTVLLTNGTNVTFSRRSVGSATASILEHLGPMIGAVVSLNFANLSVAHFTLSMTQVAVRLSMSSDSQPRMSKFAIAGVLASQGFGLSAWVVLSGSIRFELDRTTIDVDEVVRFERAAILGIAARNTDHFSIAPSAQLSFSATRSSIRVNTTQVSNVAVGGLSLWGSDFRAAPSSLIAIVVASCSIAVVATNGGAEGLALGGIAISTAFSTTLPPVQISVADRTSIALELRGVDPSTNIAVLGYAAEIGTGSPTTEVALAGSDINVTAASSTSVLLTVGSTGSPDGDGASTYDRSLTVASNVAVFGVSVHNTLHAAQSSVKLSCCRFVAVDASVSVVTFDGTLDAASVFGFTFDGETDANADSMTFAALRTHLAVNDSGQGLSVFSLRATGVSTRVTVVGSVFAAARSTLALSLPLAFDTIVFGEQARDAAALTVTRTTFLLEDFSRLDVRFDPDLYSSWVQFFAVDANNASSATANGDTSFVIRTGSDITMAGNVSVCFTQMALAVDLGTTVVLDNVHFYIAQSLFQSSAASKWLGHGVGGIVVFNRGAGVDANMTVSNTSWSAVDATIDAVNPTAEFVFQYGAVADQGHLVFASPNSSVCDCGSSIAWAGDTASPTRVRFGETSEVGPGTIANPERFVATNITSPSYPSSSRDYTGPNTTAAICVYLYPGPPVPTVLGTLGLADVSVTGTGTASRDTHTASATVTSVVTGTQTVGASSSAGLVGTPSTSGTLTISLHLVTPTRESTKSWTRRSTRSASVDLAITRTGSASGSVSRFLHTASGSTSRVRTATLTESLPLTASLAQTPSSTHRRTMTNTVLVPPPVKSVVTVAEAADATASGVATVAAVMNPTVAAQAGRLASLRALTACQTTGDISPPSLFANPTGLAIISAVPHSGDLSEESRAAVAEHAGAVVGNSALAIGMSVAFGAIMGPARQWFTHRFQGKARPGLAYALAWARYPAITLFVYEYFAGFIVASAVVVTFAGSGGSVGVRAAVVATGVLFVFVPVGVVTLLFARDFRKHFEASPVPDPTPAERQRFSRGRLVAQYLFVPTVEWQPISSGDRVAVMAPLRRQWLKNFGLAFEGYAGRAPWFLVAETLLLNVWTSVALALASTLQCQIAAWIAIFTYVIHAALLVAIRPYVVRAEAVGQALSTLCQAFAVVAALLVEMGVFEEAMASFGDWLATGASIMVTILALLEFAKVAYLQLRKRWSQRRQFGGLYGETGHQLLLLDGAEEDAAAIPFELTTMHAGNGGDDDDDDVEMGRLPHVLPGKATTSSANHRIGDGNDDDGEHWARLFEDADRLVHNLYDGRTGSGRLAVNDSGGGLIAGGITSLTPSATRRGRPAAAIVEVPRRRPPATLTRGRHDGGADDDIFAVLDNDDAPSLPPQPASTRRPTSRIAGTSSPDEANRPTNDLAELLDEPTVTDEPANAADAAAAAVIEDVESGASEPLSPSVGGTTSRSSATPTSDSADDDESSMGHGPAAVKGDVEDIDADLAALLDG